jgi:hypothetical protein
MHMLWSILQIHAGIGSSSWAAAMLLVGLFLIDDRIRAKVLPHRSSKQLAQKQSFRVERPAIG